MKHDTCGKAAVPTFVFSLLLLFLLLPDLAWAGGKDGYRIKAHIGGAPDTLCLLAYHFGDKVFVEDTFDIKGGTVVFAGDGKLPEGIYVAIVPDNGYFEFLVTEKEQRFNLSTDTSGYIKHMKVDGSRENDFFYEYQRFLSGKNPALKENAELMKKTEDADSLEMLRKNYGDLQAGLEDYRLAFIDKHPESFLGKLFYTMQEPTVPDGMFGSLDETEAERERFYYIRNHFWDNVDFSNPGLLRTPVLAGKLKKYLEQMVVSQPDSAIAAADMLITKSKADDGMFRYFLSYIARHYETSKIMGMDEVFVHIAETYILTGQADWLNEETLDKYRERVRKLKPNLLNHVAPNITLQGVDNKQVSMHSIDAPAMLVLFWDYTCGHCKKKMPHYLELYEKYKDKGFKVYSVCTRIEVDKWKTFLDEYGIGEWINVIDPYGRSDFRDNYDIYSTPVSYLLDKDKKILAKRLDPEQIDNLLEKHFEEMGQ